MDEKWLVPYFEKMLYDQALLAIAYLEAYQVTKNELFARVASQIFEYVLRDMLSPEGAFFSSESVETYGKGGLFYIWTPAEIKAAIEACDLPLKL